MTKRPSALSLALLALPLCAAPLLAPPAHAAATCARPDKPKLPPGKGTKGPEMQAAEKKVADYTGRMTTYLKCLDGEKHAAEAEHKKVIEDWNGVIDAYQKHPG